MSTLEVSDVGELSRTRLARRARILEVARACFLAGGFNATTMEGIAADANVSKATLYKYFPDKDELFYTLVTERYLAPDQRQINQFHDTLTVVVAQLKERAARDEVKQTILRLLRQASERRNDVFYRMLVELAFAQPALLARVRQEMRRDRPDDLLESVGLSAADLPSDIDGASLLHLFFVAITGYSVIEDAVIGREGMSAENLAGTFATLLCSAIK